MGNELNILYGCDDNYAPYTGVSMTSLLENNRHLDKIVIYLAGMDISTGNMEKLERTAQKYGRELVPLDTRRAQEKIRQYNLGGWNGSLATWLRFFVFDQIPETVERLLWLDSDTIVTGDLEPLCTLDMQGAPVACGCDSICYYSRKRLALDQKNAPYFNAGVILFDLRKWTQRQILPGFMERLSQCGEYYVANDQDLLNDYFRGHIYKLPPEYNLQGTHLAYRAEDYLKVFPWKAPAYYTGQELERAADAPAVVHFFRFLGDYPWEIGNNLHPARALYEQWRERSLWKGHNGPACGNKRLFRIEKALYCRLPKRVFLRIFAAVKWWGNFRAKAMPRELTDSMIYDREFDGMGPSKKG